MRSRHNGPMRLPVRSGLGWSGPMGATTGAATNGPYGAHIPGGGWPDGERWRSSGIGCCAPRLDSGFGPDASAFVRVGNRSIATVTCVGPGRTVPIGTEPAGGIEGASSPRRARRLVLGWSVAASRFMA